MEFWVASQHPTLLNPSLMRHKMYGVLCSIIAHNTPQSKSYETLVLVVKQHYQPKWLIIDERYMLNLRCHHPREPFVVAELRHLASTCHFGDIIDNALHNCLVCGLARKYTYHRLLADKGSATNFAKAAWLAQNSWQEYKSSQGNGSSTQETVGNLSFTTFRQESAIQAMLPIWQN